jgi:drug/metabolite transporter (DMT)-like permease
VTRRRADLTLIAATLIWGAAFPVVKAALTSSTPLAFLAVRFAIAAVVLTPFTPLAARFSRREIAAGALLGAVLGGGFAAQVIGLVYTTPARSAFIVGISSVLAPLVAFVVLRERPRWTALGALLVASVGLYFLTAPDAGGLNRGDLWTLGTAVLFGGQIVAVAELSRRHDPARLVWMQTAGTAVCAALGAGLLEDARIDWNPAFAAELVYSAVFATALALLLQMRAQREMSSSRAALIFCLEAVFAAAASWIWLGERLSLAQWVGGALILAGMVTAELPVAKSTAAQ